MESTLPDAPWIVDAERNGYPTEDPVICPVCGAECSTIYFNKDRSEPIACDRCLIEQDAYEWREEKENENV